MPLPTIIKFDLSELRKLADSKDSCVIEKKITQNVALHPWGLGNLKESMKNIIDYKIGRYDKEFAGILLSYKNLRILQNVGAIKNDNSDITFQVQGDYFIFKPVVGATLTGVVNKKTITHLGVLLHRVFNVVIPRPTEEPGNKWIGSIVQEGQTVQFKIVVMDLFGALPYIRGELDASSIPFGGYEGDDKLDHANITPINVSYVDYDKTKPQSQKQTGDGTPQLSPRSPNRDTQKKHCNLQRVSPINRKNNSPVKIFESDVSLSDKQKKRQNKQLDVDAKMSSVLTTSDTNTMLKKKLKRHS